MFSTMKLLSYLFLPALLLTFGCQTSPKPSPDLLDIRRFQPAAERGDVLAQYNLGAAYASQWRPVEASRWFRKAAELGSPDAEYRLAVNYTRGDGVPEDATEAYAWFDVAAAQGHVLAVNARESLASRMSRAEIGAGDRRAAEIIAKIPPQNLRYGPALGQSAKDKEEEQDKARRANAAAGASKAGSVAPAAAAPESKPKAVIAPKTAPTHQAVRYGSPIPPKGAVNQTDLSGGSSQP